VTTILITPPPAPFTITAEQVVAYLLREGSGWREDQPRHNGMRRFVTTLYGKDYRIAIHTNPGDKKWLALSIKSIAIGELRPALAVAEDIAGPVVGTVGVGCEALTGRARRERRECRDAWLAEAPRAPEVE